jgi:3-methyladenine DNA glycosylase/8-oxoguanine DNA glycosylase
MATIQELEKRREQVLEQMRSIRSLKRGTISEQYFPVMRDGKPSGERRGPYYVLSRREGERTVSRRLRSAEEVRQAREAIAAHRRFVDLCKEYEELTERLGQLERQAPDLSGEKKRRRSPSSRTGK